jgi:hypothetical protein
MSLSAFAAVPLLASLVLSYRADTGTVYVAADSRLTAAGEAGTALPPDDSACKIRVLNRGVVFVGSGNAIFTVNRRRTNIYSLAAYMANGLPHRPLTPSDIRQLALRWQAAIHSRLLAKVRAAPRTIDETAESSTGTTGSFYSASADGSVYGITLRVAPGTDGALRNIEEPAPLPGYLVATGTAEGKQEALAFAASQTSASFPWPGRLRTIEEEVIRRQSERYGRQADIGGSIDILEITKNGPAWIAHKPSCR